MKTLRTCLACALALGLAMSACAADAATHEMASGQGGLLSAIANAFGDGNGSGSTASDNAGSSHGTPTFSGNENGDSVGYGNSNGSVNSNTSSRRGDGTDNDARNTSSPVPSNASHRKAPTLSWQSLLPGSIQQ